MELILRTGLKFNWERLQDLISGLPFVGKTPASLFLRFIGVVINMVYVKDQLTDLSGHAERESPDELPVFADRSRLLNVYGNVRPKFKSFDLDDFFNIDVGVSSDILDDHEATSVHLFLGVNPERDIGDEVPMQPSLVEPLLHFIQLKSGYLRNKG